MENEEKEQRLLSLKDKLVQKFLEQKAGMIAMQRENDELRVEFRRLVDKVGALKFPDKVEKLEVGKIEVDIDWAKGREFFRPAVNITTQKIELPVKFPVDWENAPKPQKIAFLTPLGTLFNRIRDFFKPYLDNLLTLLEKPIAGSVQRDGNGKLSKIVTDFKNRREVLAVSRDRDGKITSWSISSE